MKIKNLLALISLSLLLLCSCTDKYPIRREANPFVDSAFFVPNDSSKHTSIIMLHGSEGGSEHALYPEASVLATQGFAVLALCYFDCGRNINDPRKTLKEVETTKILDAIAWLRNQTNNNGKVVVYGFSRGAELAMIVGSLPMNKTNWPNALIVHSPSDVFNPPINWNWLNRACWLCRRGISKCSKESQQSDYEWNPACGADDRELYNSIKSAWLISGINIPASKRIEIEKFNGPILITVGEKDEVWPVDQTEKVEAKLKEAGKKNEVHYFPGEGHIFKRAAEMARQEIVLKFLKNIPKDL